ncbi:MAG: signal peptidase II [Erysipelotrichaceae bacterium]|nr:signal peptidase II [Erysipelotrichaceae bacterium]
MRKSEVLILIFLVALDQITKYFVSVSMELHQSIKVLGNFLKITYVHNYGAAWSMMTGLKEVFIVAALIVVTVMVGYLAKDRKMNRWQRLVIIVLMAGTLGNLIDRFIHGYVIDFIDTYPFGYDFPVFNVADICLTLGCAALVLEILFDKEQK